MAAIIDWHSKAIVIPKSFRRLVCISLVYWLPWSVLNISGCGCFSKASLSTLITNCESKKAKAS
jgi:hypothetical protein